MVKISAWEMPCTCTCTWLYMVVHVDDNDNDGIKKWNIYPDSQRFLPKVHFWTFLNIFRMDVGQGSPSYSKRHLQHDIMPFFPPALQFTTFSSGMCRNQNWKWRTSFGFWLLNFSLPFLFLFFLSFFSIVCPSTGLASYSNTFKKAS